MAPSSQTWRSLLTIDPVLLLCAYGFFMNLPLQQQFVYYRFSESTGFPFDPKMTKSGGCGTEGLQKNTSTSEMEKEVQELASKFLMGCVLIQTLPSLIMGLFIGPWTDTGGRKLAIVFPILGAIQESLLMIGIVYFKLPLHLMYIGKALNGLTGLFIGMIQASMSYVADVTSPSQIAFRFAVMQLVVFCGGFFGQLLSGVMLSNFGFIPPYLSILVCTLVAFFYLTLFVPESLPPEKMSRQPLFTLRGLKRVLHVFTKPRDGKRTSLLLLILCDSIFCLIARGGKGVTMLYLLSRPRCFPPTMIGVFEALRFLTEGLGGVLGIVTMKKYLREENIIRVSYLFFAVAMALLAFADRISLVFLVPVISSVSGTVLPSLKGMMSKIVQPDEKGSLFTAITAFENISLVFGAFVLNAIYIFSLEVGFPGMVFLTCAVMLLSPIAFMSFLQKPKGD